MSLAPKPLITAGQMLVNPRRDIEYAVVYRHGVVNNAKAYEFWDNYGGYNDIVTSQGPNDLSGGNQ